MGKMTQTLSFRFISLVALIFLPVFGLHLYLTDQWSEASETDARAEVSRLALAAATSQENLLSSTRLLLETLALTDGIRAGMGTPGTAATCSAFLARLHSGMPHYGVLVVADRDGDVWCSSLPSEQPLNISDRGYFRQVMSTGLPVTGEYQIGRVTGLPTLALAHPLRGDSGELDGLVVASIDLSRPTLLVEDLALPEGSTVTVFDDPGTVLMRWPESGDFVGRQVTGALADLRDGGTVRSIGLDGVQRIFGAASLGDAFGSPVLVVGVPAEAVLAAAWSTFTVTSIGLIILSIGAAVVAYVLGGRLIIQPIRNLGEAARKVAGGDLKVRVAEEGATELATLAGELNTMTGALERRERELRAAERRELEEKHRKSLEREKRTHLEEAARVKDEFFALISHELRTPLTSIIGYVELVRDGLERDKTERFLEIIDRNARRLHQLVGDLLFVARMEAGELSIEPTEMELGSLAAECVETALPQANSRGVELGLHADTIPMVGDPGRLSQVIDNLISNALKFTPKGGKVEIAVEETAGWATIMVSDTGEGIAPEDLPNLFQRFYRTRSAERRAVPGTGLGLTIVKAIVEAHGGSIEVDSSPGEGTSFTLRLPTGGPTPRVIKKQVKAMR